MKLHRRALLALTLATSLAAPSLAFAEGTIKIGTLATLDGPFTVLGQDGMRGVELALKAHNVMAGGMKLEIIQGSSDASPDSAVKAARKLVEQEGVQILIGPLSGDEGLAVKDYAKTQPNVTFVNGTSAAQDTTFRDPAANFFGFSTDGAQWMAGLGEYAFTAKGYKRVAVVAEDYSFPYTQVFGFMAGFCKAGGAAPLAGGSITVDQSVLGSEGKTKDAVIGTPSAGPISDTDDSPAWKKFVAGYKAAFADGFPSPSLFAHGYYINTTAVLLALDAVGGDVSGDQAKFRDALSKLSFDTPAGKVSLDKNRSAIADIYLTEVTKLDDGKLYNKVVKVIPQVNQTLNTISPSPCGSVTMMHNGRIFKEGTPEEIENDPQVQAIYLGGGHG